MIFRTGGAGLMVPGVEVIQAISGDTPWWLAAGVTPVAAYAPKGAADLASSYVNLANPGTNNAAPGVAPTFNASTGWTFNGSTTYLTTGVVATRSYTALIRFSGSPSGYLFGAFKTAGTTIFGFTPVNGGNHHYWNGTTNLIVVGNPTSGVVAIAGATGYLNGSSEGSLAADADTGLAVFIGALNQAGSPSNFTNAAIQAFWIASSTLNGTQVGQMTTAMQAL